MNNGGCVENYGAGIYFDNDKRKIYDIKETFTVGELTYGWVEISDLPRQQREREEIGKLLLKVTSILIDKTHSTLTADDILDIFDEMFLIRARQKSKIKETK